MKFESPECHCQKGHTELYMLTFSFPNLFSVFNFEKQLSRSLPHFLSCSLSSTDSVSILSLVPLFALTLIIKRSISINSVLYVSGVY